MSLRKSRSLGVFPFVYEMRRFWLRTGMYCGVKTVFVMSTASNHVRNPIYSKVCDRQDYTDDNSHHENQNNKKRPQIHINREIVGI